MNVFQFDTVRITRALLAVVFTIFSLSYLSHAQTSDLVYVDAECYDTNAVHKSLKWLLLGGQPESPLKDADPPYWECNHDGTDYKPNVLHVSAALKLYGPPYDDLILSMSDGDDSSSVSVTGVRKIFRISERNPHYRNALLAIYVDNSNRCYRMLPEELPYRYLGSGDRYRCDAFIGDFNTESRRYLKAHDAFAAHPPEWFALPFETFVKRSLAEGLQGKNPHDSGSGDNDSGGSNGGSDIGNGDGDPADFQGWTPFQATENAFDSLKGCIADKFQHLFDVAQQKFPVMFGSFVPQSSINNASATPCQDYNITMMGITKPLPFCDNPIMNAIRNVVRPALLALYMITAYIGLSRLVAWS